MIKTEKNKKEGFTLVEFLLYGVIVTMIMGGLVLTGINIIKGRSKVTISGEMGHSGVMILERISSAIREAEAVNSPVGGSWGNVLSLEMKLSEENPTIFEVDESGNLILTIGAEPPTAITSEKVKVNNLTITNVSYPEKSETIKIDLTLKHYNPSGRSDYEIEKKFFTTENVR